MAISQVNGAMRHLCRTVDGGLTDAQLLDCFLEHRDERAFEALVRRHGPMVLGVCRRVLQNLHDAEDAFQATFLVLARKASTIVPREMVGNWLYGVAYRTALKARAESAKRKAKERQVIDMPGRDSQEMWLDLQPLLDQELNHLPDKYRVPVVLCDLEGKTRKEAAQQLGWPEGTLSWRLASARETLAKRLTRRGLVLSAGALALVLSQNTASAVVPMPLVASTVKAAALSGLGQAVTAGVISANVAALTEGVLTTMFVTKLKIAAAMLLALTVVGTGVGVVSYQTATGQDNGRRAEAAQQADRRGGERPRRAIDFAGKITAISNDGKTLTLAAAGANRGDEPKKVELKITDKTQIEFVGLLKDLGKKLKAGDNAQIWLQEGSQDTAGVIHASTDPDISAKIAAVAADGKVLTLELPGQGRGEVVKTDIKLTDKTKIGSNVRGGAEQGKPQVGYLATVWFEEGSKDTAAALQISRPNPNAIGEISAVSNDGKTLTLDVKARNGEVSKAEIKITDQTKIETPGADKAELKVGLQAMVWYQEGSNDTAATVHVAPLPRPSPDVSGKIAAISQDGKTITIEIQRRGEASTKTEIKLSDKTKVEFAGTDKAEEKKLTVGYHGTVWLEKDSKDTAAVIQATKPEERRR